MKTLPSDRVVTGSQVSVTLCSPPTACKALGAASDSSGTILTSSERLALAAPGPEGPIRYPYTWPYLKLESLQKTLPFLT